MPCNYTDMVCYTAVNARAAHADREQADWDTTLARWDHHVSGRFAVCCSTCGGLPLCWVKSHQLDAHRPSLEQGRPQPAALPVKANHAADVHADHKASPPSRQQELFYPVGLPFVCISIWGRAVNSDLSRALRHFFRARAEEEGRTDNWPTK